MLTTVEALYTASVAIEALVLIYGSYKTFTQPKKVRYVLMTFCILTMPASIINVMSYMEKVSMHWNSFAYLSSTLLMLALHFWLNLDVGKHLRSDGIEWKHPLVLVGAAGLGGSMTCLTAQLIILLIRNDSHPIRPAFVTGVCLAILCDGATYIYSFSALIHFKRQRFHEGQSRTTSLGVWFLSIQCIWYSVFGVLYVWFFCQPWDYFTTLLVFDYLMRFILCLMFTWPPPHCVIQFMLGRLFSDLSGKNEADTTRHNDPKSNNTSDFTVIDIKANSRMSYGYQQKAQFIKYTHDVRTDDVESANNNPFYSSNAAIVAGQ